MRTLANVLPASLRHGLLIAALALGVGAGMAAGAGATGSDPVTLVLGGAQPVVDAWPAVTLLSDESGSQTIEQVLEHSDRFSVPTGPHANLGPRKDVVWFRVPMRVEPADNGRWVAEIDYASLDRADVYLVRDGAVVFKRALGDHLTFNQRPMAVRAHAVELPLLPGHEYVLLLRVQSRSSMIVPLRLIKPDAFLVEESKVQLVQGLTTGLALCMVLYALGQWAGNREPMFLYYALKVCAVALSFFAYYGLAPQYLWPDHAWLTDNAATMVVLFAIAGALLLVEQMLGVRAASRRLSLTMKSLAGVASMISVLFALDIVGYRMAHLAGTILGPMPFLLGVHLAFKRAREGDEAARYVLVGWSAYTIGALTLIALLRGWVDFNVWIQHAFQIGAMCESIVWLRVLGVRSGAIRRQAERAEHERELLRALADTDALTGLPNRRGLDRALAAALAQTSAGGGLAVYLVDLDGFKAVNDEHGHDAGDELLVAVAARLKGLLRGADIVARLGGDEFVVVARSVSTEVDGWRLGQKLVDAFVGKSFIVREQPCLIGLTVGFALSPNDGTDAANLLKRADAAMYAGKRSGKGTVRRGGASAGLVST